MKLMDNLNELIAGLNNLTSNGAIILIVAIICFTVLLYVLIK